MRGSNVKIRWLQVLILLVLIVDPSGGAIAAITYNSNWSDPNTKVGTIGTGPVWEHHQINLTITASSFPVKHTFVVNRMPFGATNKANFVDGQWATLCQGAGGWSIDPKCQVTFKAPGQYKVYAYATSGNTYQRHDWIITVQQALTAPGLITLSSNTRDSISIKWDPAKGPVSRYEVQFRKNWSTWPWSAKACGKTTATSITCSGGMTPATGYLFRVRALDANRNPGPWSKDSKVFQTAANQPPSAPMNVQASGVTASAATVSWRPSNDPDRDPVTYTVEYKKKWGLSWTSAGKTTSTSIGLTRLSEGTTYDVRITASDGFGGTATTTWNAAFKTKWSASTTKLTLTHRQEPVSAGGTVTFDANIDFVNSWIHTADSLANQTVTVTFNNQSQSCKTNFLGKCSVSLTAPAPINQVKYQARATSSGPLITGNSVVDTVTVKAKPAFTVTGSVPGPGGRIISPTSVQVQNPQGASFMIQANTGYVVNPTVNDTCGAGGSWNNNQHTQYVTASITRNCSVTFTFDPQVTATAPGAGQGGALAGGLTSQTKTASSGSVSFSVRPDINFVAAVKNTNCPAGSFDAVGTTYTITNVTAPCTVDFVFNPKTHTVTATAGVGGAVSPASRQVAHGSTASFTLSPNQGYVVDTTAVTDSCGAGGGFNPAGTTYTTGRITGPCQLHFGFSLGQTPPNMQPTLGTPTVTTPVTSGRSSTIAFQAQVTNRDTISHTYWIGASLLDASGLAVQDFYAKVTPQIAAGQTATISFNETLLSGLQGSHKVIVALWDIKPTPGSNATRLASATSAAFQITSLDAPIDIYADAVFMRNTSEPAKVSVLFDNSDTEQWTQDNEASDYAGQANYLASRNGKYSHMLYGYKDWDPQFDAQGELTGFQDAGQLGAGSLLQGRIPLILIHGWEGDKGDNNYIGMNRRANMPEQYFQELLAFYDMGGSDPTAPQVARDFYNKYKIYLYHYPSFEHITYNGRMLGELIGRMPDLRGYIEEGGKMVIVAHSMGGLVARSFIEEHGINTTVPTGVTDAAGDPEGKVQQTLPWAPTAKGKLPGEAVVETLITLATPHHGSPGAMTSWVDTASVVGKELGTPGSMDLYWDDMDGVLGQKLGACRAWTVCELTSYFSNDYYPLGNQSVYFWRNRATGANKKMDRFDKAHGESRWIQPVPNQPGTSYESPNPWLRSLNEAYKTKAPNVRYITYAGSIPELMGFANILENGGKILGVYDKFKYRQVAYTVGSASGYPINDSVVPTKSALFDLVPNPWSLNYADNLSRVLTAWAVPLFTEGFDGQHWYRFFSDYGHDKMRGGSGHLDTQGFGSGGVLHGPRNVPNNYANNWNTPYAPNDYNQIFGALTGNDLVNMPVPIAASSDLLKYEPLFLKLAQDLDATAQTLAGETRPEVSVVGSVGGSTSPSGLKRVAAGSSLSVSAAPAQGYQFVRWMVSGAGSVLDPYAANTTLTVNGGVVAQAIFEPAPAANDTQAPMITVTSHLNNATITGTATTMQVLLTGTVSDAGKGDNGVASLRVQNMVVPGFPVSGSAIGQWSQMVTLQPGTNTITISAVDGSANANPATLTLTLTYQQQAKTTQAIMVDKTSLTVAEGASASFGVRLLSAPAANVAVAIAKSAGGDPDLTARTTTLIFTPTDWMTYQYVTIDAAPDPDMLNGTAEFRLSSTGLSSVPVMTTEFDTTKPNQAPAPAAPPISVNAGQSGTSQILPNDPNPGDTHTYAVTTQPASGKATVSASGLASYTPNAGFASKDSFVVTVTDQGGLSATVTIPVTVNAAVDAVPPVITLKGNSVVSVPLGGVFTEPGYTAVDNVDGDITVNVKVTGGPVNTKAPVGTVYTLTYAVSDAAGNTASVKRTVRLVSSLNAPLYKTYTLDSNTVPTDLKLVNNSNALSSTGTVGITGGRLVATPVDTNGWLETKYTVSGAKRIRAKATVTVAYSNWGMVAGIRFVDALGGDVLTGYAGAAGSSPNYTASGNLLVSGGSKLSLPAYGSYNIELIADVDRVVVNLYDMNNRLLGSVVPKYLNGKTFSDIAKIRFYVYTTTGSDATIDNLVVDTRPSNVASRHDFDGDGKSDILYYQATTGRSFLRLMNGQKVASQGFAGTLPTSWKVAGTGDFNGDGKSDILYHQASSGRAFLRLMNGQKVISQGFAGTLPTSWKIAGVGDFNGDGKSDILYHQASSGRAFLRLMNGRKVASQGFAGTLPTSWKIAGVGDFNGDGKSDILYHQASSGRTFLRLMNGRKVVSQGFVGRLPTSWKVAGVGDFNGDGKSDILYHQASSGRAFLRLMNGRKVASQGFVANLPSSWKIAAVGDYNGDGKSDILYHQASSGRAFLRLMNGRKVASQGFVRRLAASWAVVGY